MSRVVAYKQRCSNFNLSPLSKLVEKPQKSKWEMVGHRHHSAETLEERLRDIVHLPITARYTCSDSAITDKFRY